MSLKVLVTGASGVVGSQVVNHLRRRPPEGEVEITAGVYERSTKKDKKHIWEGAHLTEYLDYETISPQSLARYDAVFLIPTISEERTKHVFNVCTAYKGRQDGFLVLCSASEILGYETDWSKGFRIMEYIVKASGIPYAFLQCGFLFQNFFHHAEQLKQTHELRMPLGHGYFAPIHASDVGRAAAKILLNASHYVGHAFNLVGQQLVSGNDIVDIITQAVGYRVKYTDIPVTVYRDFLLERGVSEFAADSLCDFCQMIRAHKLDGRGSTMGTTVVNLLDNQVTSLKAFFLQYEDTFGGTHRHSGGYENEAEWVRQRRLTEEDYYVKNVRDRESASLESRIETEPTATPQNQPTGAGFQTRSSWKPAQNVRPREDRAAVIKEQLERIYVIMREMAEGQHGLVRYFEDRINRELPLRADVMDTYKPIRTLQKGDTGYDYGVSTGEWRGVSQYAGESETAPKRRGSRWSRTAFARDMNLDRFPSTRLSRESRSYRKSDRNESLLRRISMLLYGFTMKQPSTRSYEGEQSSKFNSESTSRDYATKGGGKGNVSYHEAGSGETNSSQKHHERQPKMFWGKTSHSADEGFAEHSGNSHFYSEEQMAYSAKYVPETAEKRMGQTRHCAGCGKVQEE